MKAILQGWHFDSWRWAGFGLRVSRLVGGAGLGESVYLLRATRSAALPKHGHTGMERIVILHGAFRDGAEVFSPGDLSERTEEDGYHRPIADTDCLCLVALDSPLRAGGITSLYMRYLGI